MTISSPIISPITGPITSPIADEASYKLAFSYDKQGRVGGAISTHANGRTATATVVDWEGVVKFCEAGETRIEGARRVFNMATALTTHSVTVEVDRVYQISCTGDNGSTVVLSGAATGTLTNDGSIQQGFDTPKTATTTTLTLTITGTLTGLLVEDVTGQANTAPSDIIAHDTDHGWGANGVAYYDYENGNTISGGVVTSSKGGDITGISVLAEPSSTNEALWCRDFTNAAWSKTNITAAKDATGIDGQINAASTLTAGAANGTVFQTITKASAENTFSIDVKRKTGSGTIEITDNGGTSYTDITSSINSSTYTRVTLTNTQANPSIGFRIVTSGDEIEVDFAGLEGLGGATSRIETGAASVVRDNDAITFSSADEWFPSTEGFSLLKVTPQLDWATLNAVTYWVTVAVSGNLLAYRNGSNDGVRAYDGTNVPTILAGHTPGTPVTIVTIWSTSLNQFQVGYYNHQEATWHWDPTPTAYAGFTPTTLSLMRTFSDVEKAGGLKIFSGLPAATLAATQTWIENNRSSLIG